jgi:hypothetical protein
MNRIKILLLLSILLNIDVSAELNQTDPLSVVKTFVDGEFNGIQEMRFDLVKLSPKEKKRLNLGSMRYVIFWDADPMVIVSTFCIVSVQAESDKGVGRVIFERLAYTRGYGSDVNNNLNPREIISEYKESEEVEYNLIKTSGKWYIYDPPAGRISLAAVIKYYFDQAMSFLPGDFWIDPKFSNAQRRNIAKEFFDIKLLMKISTDYLKRLEKRYETLGGPDYPDKERRQRVKGFYNGKWNLEIISEKTVE